LGTPEAAAAFAADFASALREYAASDLGDLSRMARRAGLDARTPPHSSSSSSSGGGGGSGSGAGSNLGRGSAAAAAAAVAGMPLDPWNIDFLIARAAELQAAPKSPR